MQKNKRQHLPCFACERIFDTPQGRSAHIRVGHPQHFKRYGTGPAPASKNTPVHPQQPKTQPTQVDLPTQIVDLPGIHEISVNSRPLGALDHLDNAIRLFQDKLATVAIEIEKLTGQLTGLQTEKTAIENILPGLTRDRQAFGSTAPQTELLPPLPLLTAEIQSPAAVAEGEEINLEEDTHPDETLKQRIEREWQEREKRTPPQPKRTYSPANAALTTLFLLAIGNRSTTHPVSFMDLKQDRDLLKAGFAKSNRFYTCRYSLDAQGLITLSVNKQELTLTKAGRAAYAALTETKEGAEPELEETVVPEQPKILTDEVILGQLPCSFSDLKNLLKESDIPTDSLASHVARLNSEEKLFRIGNELKPIKQQMGAH